MLTSSSQSFLFVLAVFSYLLVTITQAKPSLSNLLSDHCLRCLCAVKICFLVVKDADNVSGLLFRHQVTVVLMVVVV